jgi:hypothetical protein
MPSMRTLMQVVTLTLCTANLGHAALHTCEGTQISVLAQHDSDATLACEAARRAIAFFADQGFHADIAATILVEEEPSSPTDWSLLGSFDARRGEIRVLSLHKAMESAPREPPFGEPMHAQLHASFIAHELRHALAKANFTIARPSVLAHEYVAYTVRLATMPDTLRQDILSRYQLEGFQHEREIGETYYLVNPHAFAVKAYPHFRRPENGSAFLSRVFNGLLSPTQRPLQQQPN